MLILTRGQIIAGLNGNSCRCTGYYKIVQAIKKATGKLSSSE